MGINIVWLGPMIIRRMYKFFCSFFVLEGDFGARTRCKQHSYYS